MHAICVRAIPWGSNVDVVHRQVGAAIDVCVEELAVQGSDPLDQGVVHMVELKRLQQTRIK